MYDAVGGRFVSRDPIGFSGGSYCLHEYVKGRPYFYIDPDGTFIQIIVKKICEKIVVPAGKACAKKIGDGCRWVIEKVKGPPKTNPPGPPHTWPNQPGVQPVVPKAPGAGNPLPKPPTVNPNPKPKPGKPTDLDDWIDQVNPYK